MKDKIKDRTKENQENRYFMIKTVQDWMSKGYSKKTIQVMIEKVFGYVSFSAQNRLINEAMELINEGLDKETIIQANMEFLDSLREMATNDKKYRDAITAISEQNKMMGVYKEENKKVNVKNGDQEIVIEF